MGFFDFITEPIKAVTNIITGKNETNRAKDIAREQAGIAKNDNATQLALADKQTEQLEKEIAFRQQQADEDRKVQLQAVETSRFLAEQGLELEEKALEAAEKAAKQQSEAIKEQARATDTASANNLSASILAKPDLKQLAIPALLGVYLYYKFMR